MLRITSLAATAALLASTGIALAQTPSYSTDRYSTDRQVQTQSTDRSTPSSSTDRWTGTKRCDTLTQLAGDGFPSWFIFGCSSRAGCLPVMEVIRAPATARPL